MKYEEIERAKRRLELQDMLCRTGLAKEELTQLFWKFSMTPNGRVSEKFIKILEGMAGKAIAAQMLKGRPVTMPDVALDQAVHICIEMETERIIAIAKQILTHHVLIGGAPGSGKTTFIATLIAWAVRNAIKVIFSDHKAEGRRMLNLFDDVVVMRPHDMPMNLLEPPSIECAAIYFSAFFAEFAKAFGLLPITSTQLVSLMDRIGRGLRRGQPWPSITDFVRVLHRLGKSERSKFSTAAHAFDALIPILGENARIQRGIEPDALIEVYEWQGIPPRVHQFLAAVLLLRTQMRAAAQGFNSDLKVLYVSDEAIFEFGKEVSQTAGSGYINFAKRSLTQMRAYGLAICAACQSLSDIDHSLKANVGTYVFFRSPHDAEEALQLLGDYQ